MFGRNKSNNSYDVDNHDTLAASQGSAPGNIPYEVYETIHEPAARRRRWTVRLIAALLAVTMLIVGGTALHKKLNTDDVAQKAQLNGAAQTMGPSNGSRQTNAASQQAPQSNAPLQKSDSNATATSQDDGTNTGTVNQPE